MLQTVTQDLAAEVAKLSRRLERERKIRLAAEAIAEKGLRELYEKQQQLQVLEKIAVAANQTASVGDALQFSITTICQYTGWMLGHAYLCEQEAHSKRLYSTSIWYSPELERFQEFHDLTEKTHFDPGVGLPGRVLATGAPAWIVDVTEDSNFPRAQAARLVDIKAGFAFPVLVGNEVVAVLEFFTDKVSEPDQILLRVMSQVGTQLGRCVERKRAQDRLERLSVLGQLTATVAHELRNPLSAIRNTLPVMREMTAGKGVELDRPMSRVERSIARCDQLVSGLLDYTRPCVLSRNPTHLALWLGEVLDEQTLPAGVVIEREFSAPDCVVNLDPDRFRRVIINLIDNAAQAIAQEQTSGAARKITIATTVSDHAEIIVKDTGPGIAPDVLPRIFEPLFSTKNFGTGLGLPIVRQLVEQHGGRIAIESELGRGTTVHISLPLSSQQKVAA